MIMTIMARWVEGGSGPVRD